MNASLYTLHSLGWSSAGLVLGVVLDRVVLALQQIAHTTRSEDHVPTTDRPSRRQRWQSLFNSVVVPAVVIAMAIATAVQGVVTARINAAQDDETKRVLNCQQAYGNGFADAIDARANTNREAQDALDELMTVVGELTTGGASPAASERFRTALSDYLAKRATAKQQQKENPYPPAPRDLCK